MDIFDQLSQEAKKAGDFIVEKANVVKDFTVATWNAAEIRNKMDGLYKTIGKMVYQAHTTGEDTASEIDDCIQSLSVLEEALKVREEEKQAIKNKKVCPACGKSTAKDNAFCPYCGASVQ